MNKLYNPIAIYNFNNKKYFIALDGNKIVYFKYENNEVSDDYSDEELEVFFKVYGSIKIDKDSAINLGHKNLRGKVFEVFYDVKKELYFWYELVNGKRVKASKLDLEYLNHKYNNLSLKYTEVDDRKNNNNEIFDWKSDSNINGNNVSDNVEIFDWATDPSLAGDEKKEKIKTFSRAIIHRGKTYAVVLVSGVCLATFSDAVLHTNIAERLRGMFDRTSVTDEVKDEEPDDIQYSYEIVTEAIDANENLSEGEKTFIKQFKSYFDQNNQYMDLNCILDRLSKLKITYIQDECESPQIAGAYDIVENAIKIYSTDSFENCDKSVFAHEILHATQRGYSNRLIMELSDEAATREYLRELVETGVISDKDFKNEYDVPVYGDGYDQCMKVYYYLANLLDQETIRKYQCIPTDFGIINALVDIDKKSIDSSSSRFNRYNMDKRAIELLDAIDELRSAPDDYGFMNVDYSDEKCEKICEMLDYYYKIEFGKTIDECFVEDIMSYDNTYGQIDTTTAKGRAIWNVMLAELQKNVENLYDGYEIPMGEYRYVLPRSYFSDRHQNPIIYFNTYEEVSLHKYHGFFVDIELTPEISKAYSEQYKIAELEISSETGDIADVESEEFEKD